MREASAVHGIHSLPLLVRSLLSRWRSTGSVPCRSWLLRAVGVVLAMLAEDSNTSRSEGATDEHIEAWVCALEASINPADQPAEIRDAAAHSLVVGCERILSSGPATLALRVFTIAFALLVDPDDDVRSIAATFTRHLGHGSEWVSCDSWTAIESLVAACARRAVALNSIVEWEETVFRWAAYSCGRMDSSSLVELHRTTGIPPSHASNSTPRQASQRLFPRLVDGCPPCTLR
eukprot:Opistho-2@15569